MLTLLVSVQRHVPYLT